MDDFRLRGHAIGITQIDQLAAVTGRKQQVAGHAPVPAPTTERAQ